MYVQVRTIDGKKTTTLNVSKTTKILDFKTQIADSLDVDPEKQRLFFRGKQLEDMYTLFDYNINLNDVVQLMVKQIISPTSKNTLLGYLKRAPSSNVSLPVDSNENKENENTIDGSKYYRVGDIVDAKDSVFGAWFEAKIISIEKQTDVETKCNADSGDEFLYKVQFIGALENQEYATLSLKDIRPQAHNYISVDDVKEGDTVMINYNVDEPSRRGYWYDCCVTKIGSERRFKYLRGDINVGVNGVVLKDCKVLFMDEIMRIEQHQLLSSRTQVPNSNDSTLRVNGPYCEHCMDNIRRNCKECGCHVCGKKDNPAKQVMCDECNGPYHLWCLTPPLTEIPDIDEWYCPECKNDENEVVKAGEKLKESKKKAKMPSTLNLSKRDWGKGFACIGRTKECTIVPSNHFGPVPGIEVGTSWKFRMQVSEAGVHRPVVAGISGRENEGAYSIALSGGYEDDVDDGDEFLYTGSGGRDLSGNKRTSVQSSDQTLTRFNKALALNCNTKLNANGAESKDWQKGKPVRVVRNYKLSKHSKYAPQEGNRYDGIYKVVKYYKQKGMSGFDVWRFVLRRDDPSPAPWTKKGKERIQSLGLEMIYPKGYLEAMEVKEAKSPISKSTRGTKRALEESNDKSNRPPKRSAGYTLDEDLQKLIKQDLANEKLWDSCMDILPNGRQKFFAQIEDVFMCICCQELLYNPVTTDCGHNICLTCLRRSFSAEVFSCPHCRFELGKKYEMKVNEVLSDVLLSLFPGYTAGRS